jgi:hypothetical protein
VTEQHEELKVPLVVYDADGRGEITGRHANGRGRYNTAARKQYEPRHAAPEPQPAEETTP